MRLVDTGMTHQEMVHYLSELYERSRCACELCNHGTCCCGCEAFKGLARGYVESEESGT